MRKMLICFGLMMTLTLNANAGVLIGVGTMYAGAGGSQQLKNRYLVIGLGALVTVGSMIISASMLNVHNSWGALVFTLDASEGHSIDLITEFLAKKFPFVEGREALQLLARKIDSIHQSIGRNGELVNITLEPAFVRDSLASENLTDSELDLVVKQLM